MLSYYKTPVQEIVDHPVCAAAGVRLLVKREDMNHPSVSGNKWWKLKYNLEAALSLGYKSVLTFGGAFSNHLYACAAATRELGLTSVGVVRGEETLPLNPTLQFAAANGMILHYVSRSVYRQKTDPAFIGSLHRRFGEFFLIPEGGSNDLAVKGCAEFARQELSEISFDHLFLAVGTGGTMAGLVSGLEGHKNITGVSVLKGGAFLENDIREMITSYAGQTFGNWSVLTQYHEGGYAKTNPALLFFMREMSSLHDLTLDHVYTAKMMNAVIREIGAGSFKRGSTILALHTGGLQGSQWLSTAP